MVSCPKELEPFEKAYKLKLQQQDRQAYTLGMYVMSAVSTAIEHNFAGKKAKSKYMKEPLLLKVFENDGLTEEEIQEKEIRKAILAEEQHIVVGINKGLPETIIK